MKISRTVPPVFGDQAPTPARNDTAPRTRVNTSADRVEISSKAQEVRWAADEVKKMPDVDLKKVAEIKAMLQTGTYRIVNRKIAAKMVEEALLGDQ